MLHMLYVIVRGALAITGALVWLVIGVGVALEFERLREEDAEYARQEKKRASA